MKILFFWYVVKSVFTIFLLLLIPAVSLSFADPLTSINNPDLAENIRFGHSVDISEDYIVIGEQDQGSSSGPRGAVYLYETDGDFESKITNPVDSNTGFGTSVLFFNDDILISSPQDDSDAIDAGIVYLYNIFGNLETTFANPNPSNYDHFGTVIAASDDHILISAPYATPSVSYLFDSAGNSIKTFNDPNPSSDSFFGSSLAIDGNNVLVGDPNYDSDSFNDIGIVYLFDTTSGNLLKTFENPTPDENDQFGQSIAISDDDILIGAYADDIDGTTSGVVYRFDATSGDLVSTISNPSGYGAFDQFGSHISFHDEYVLISGRNDGEPSNIQAGSVYLYDSETFTLLKLIHNPTPEANDLFGWSASIFDDIIVIGAPYDNTGLPSAGSVYTYDTVPDDLPEPFVLEITPGYPDHLFNIDELSYTPEFDFTPTDVAISDDGTIYATDSANNVIQVFDSDGDHLSSIGTPGTGDGEFNGLSGIAIDDDGNIYTSEIDVDTTRIQVFDSDGEHSLTFGSRGVSLYQFKMPAYIDVDDSSNIFVADTGNNKIKVFDDSGDNDLVFGSEGESTGYFRDPNSVAVGSDGTIYVADMQNNRIQTFDSDGDFLSSFGNATSLTDFFSPIDVAVDSDDNVYVTDLGLRPVHIYDEDGVLLYAFGASGTGDEQFSASRGIALDDEGRIYVSDKYNFRIQVFESISDPVDDTPDPVDDTPDPVDDTPDPVDDTPDPVDDTPDPVEETPKVVDPVSDSCTDDSKLSTNVDKSSYTKGDKISVSFELCDIVSDEYIITQILDPFNAPLNVDQFLPESDDFDKQYSTAGGVWKVDGKYTAKSTYLGATTESTFNFVVPEEVSDPVDDTPVAQTSVDSSETIASFVDETKDPQYYVDRYNNEVSYKEWFEKNYPQYDSIYDAVGLDESSSKTSDNAASTNTSESTPVTEPEKPTCGAGTKLVDGFCQVITTDEKPTCGAGTKLVDGFCQVITTDEKPTCGAGTKLVDGFCQIVEADTKSSEKTSFFDNIFGFFKKWF